MNELRNTLIEEFKDKEVRDVYCNEFLNSSIATQIKVLREQRNLTQSELAKLAGMKQSRIATLEDVNYSSWSINTLQRIAVALDLTLTVQFDSFGSKLFDIISLSRESLKRDSFEDDRVFQEDLSIQYITFSGNVIVSSAPMNVEENFNMTDDLKASMLSSPIKVIENLSTLATNSDPLNNTLIMLAA